MTLLNSRLQPIFASTRTICFGRFLIDIPASATVAWGSGSVDLGIGVYPGEARKIDEEARKFRAELERTEAIHLNRVPLFRSEEEVTAPEGKIIVGYDGFDTLGDFEMHGYFHWGDDGFIIDARPLEEGRGRAIAKIKSIARRLQPRAEHAIPSEPGNCLENAFLIDESQPNAELPVEHIRIGFRLKEFPDTHLSVFVGPPDVHHNPSNTLEFQLARLEQEQRAEDPNHPLLKTVYFRRGPRKIHDWLNGYEALSRTPEQPDMRSIHDFVMDFRGVVGDSYKPYADIRMQTGVADNLAGAVKPSLTDEEAVAVWDAITSTIRVRPTTTKASAQATPRVRLGERLASGRTCSQTGWWQATEPAAAHALPRQRIEAGATMPMAIVAGKPAPGEKLNGEQPRHEIAAVWQLVAYEE
jgi:Tle cognate immunity protein 4 C-terminal domain/Tle cognate immunity protein 4 N-terminal domain